MVKRLIKREQGYTLLEYVAGATVVGAVLYAALNSLGGDLQQFLQALGDWAGRRAAQLDG
jgi:hypothetical protein